MDDQRKYERIRKQIIITLEASTSEGTDNQSPAWLTNISITGAGIEAAEPVDPGTLLSVEIPDRNEDGSDASILLSAKVVRAEEQSVSGGYELGVEFNGMTVEDYKKVIALLDKEEAQMI